MSFCLDRTDLPFQNPFLILDICVGFFPQLSSIMADVIALILKDGVCHVVILPDIFFISLHDIFTVSEQEIVNAKLTDSVSKYAVIAVLLEAEVHRSGELFGIKYLKFKKELFRNPYLQGVNLMFPFLERRQAIFIDFVVFFFISILSKKNISKYDIMK